MKTTSMNWKIIFTAGALTWTSVSFALAQGNGGGTPGSGFSPGGLSGGSMTTLPGTLPPLDVGTPSFAMPYRTPGSNNPNTLGVPGGVKPTYPNPGSLGAVPSPSYYPPPRYGEPNIFDTPEGGSSPNPTNPFSSAGSLGDNNPTTNNPYVLGTPGSSGRPSFSTPTPLGMPGSGGTLTNPNANPFGTSGSMGSSFGSR